MDEKNILNIPVIAITGSSGKTTTKEMLAAILQKRWNVLKSIENGNSPWHTSQYLKKFNSSYDVAVLEYGMTHVGSLAEHCQLIQPVVGIITNVGTAHIGKVEGSLEGIAEEKSALINGMKSTGTLLLNADDDNSRLLKTQDFKGKTVTVGIRTPSDYQAEHISVTDKGMFFRVQFAGKGHKFYIPTLGIHNIYNALFAIAVSHLLGISTEDIAAGLNAYEHPDGRLIIYRLRGITLIDDTYSANPNAVKAAIDVLSHIGTGTNIAILGTMLELGSYTMQGHMEVGKYLAGKKVNVLYTLEEAELIGQGAIEAGFPHDKVVHCISKDQLHRQLLGQITPNTTILIKGSRALKMEETVKYLMKFYKGKA